MNKGISKWPSRALNLLVVLAMVISLSAILVAPPIAAAQEWTPECNPSPVYNSCHLEVAVNTYLKTTGDPEQGGSQFIPETNFGPTQCFYVNAVVVNTGNGTAIAPINATITLPSGVELAYGEEDYTGPGTLISTKQWLGNLTYAAPDGLIADFWWKVCCNEANGNNTIRVNATAAVPCVDQLCPASGTATVYQGEEPENRCLDIEIVEFPGMGNKTGLLLDDQGHQVIYHMTVPGTINTCTNFGVKAEITNTCGYTLYNVAGNISWTGPATLVGGDPLGWNIGTLASGQTKGVGWTLHCDGPGDVVVTVYSENNVGIQNLIDNPRTVHQATPGGLTVEIIDPTCATDGCSPSCEIKQPAAAPTSTCSQLANFTVTARVTNTGDTNIINIYAVASALPATGWVMINNPINGNLIGPFVLGPGEHQDVVYSARCLGNGTGNITATASGVESPSGLPVIAVPGPLGNVLILHQKDAIASVSHATDPDAIATPSVVNKCQDYYVTFKYTNYTANGWNIDSAHGNITACINWDGPAELTGKVQYRKIVGGVPESWQNLNLTPTGNESVGDCENLKAVICSCCATEVRWHFRCTDAGNCTDDASVRFWSTLTVDQNSPVLYHAVDTSESVCVDQVWKAHLTSDVFFFIQQEDTKIMILQNAVVPGTYFHVVIPVINTGDATAEDVQVYFTVTDDPTGTCTESYEFISSSGDGSISFNEQTGVGIASLGDIPGHSAKKAILVLHCLCEGHVSVTIPEVMLPSAGWGEVKGVRAIDANTDEAVPQANISTPPCPRVLEQIPFTVVIENPYTCQTFAKGTTFPVKAKVSNGSIMDLNNVSVTLSWGASDNVQLLGNQTLGADGHSCTKFVGNVSALSFDEMTWELECTGATHDNGEVYLTVSATLPSPLLSCISDTVNVHQTEPPITDIYVEILSPDPGPRDNHDDEGDTKIATGEEFAVTAYVYNTSSMTAEDVVATISSLDLVSLTGTQLAGIPVGTLTPYTSKVVSWTLHADYTDEGECGIGYDTIRVNVTTSTDEDSLTNNGDTVEVEVYPVAFLMVEDVTFTDMQDNPITSNSVLTCSEFKVNYKVYNYGEADAWEAGVTLTVSPEGSVRPAAGSGGYNQYLGTIRGWNWGENYNESYQYANGTFVVHCKLACESTLTISPWGNDECGWTQVLAYVNTDGWSSDTQVQWVQMPGAAIQSRFLIPAEQTMKQLESGQLDLAITKTVDNAFPAAGQIVNFTVTVTNNGPTAASGVVVTDTEVAGLTFGAATASQGTFTSGVWTVGNLIVGGSATLVIPATVGSTDPITNTAEITAVDQPDPFADNDSASRTLNKPAPTGASFSLRTGWNLISLPLIPTAAYDTPSEMFSGLMGSTGPIVQIRTYENCTTGGTWYAYIRSGPNNLSTMKDGNAYWVKMDPGFATTTITFTGYEQPEPPTLPKKYTVCVGWNMQGFKEIEAMPAGAYLGNVNYVRIWSFVNGAYSPVTSVDEMQPGLGYWIAVPSVVTGVSDTIYP